MDVFTAAFAVLIGEEGGFTNSRADPGNWTGGAVGRGRCAGTKFGISAAAHPTLDIAALTLAQAQAIYRQSYWDPIHGDELPAPLALLAFDACVNCGTSRAIGWLQKAAGAKVDGTLGPATLEAIKAQMSDVPALCGEFQAQRLLWMAALPTWRSFGLGWARRLCRLPYLSLSFGGA